MIQEKSWVILNFMEVRTDRNKNWSIVLVSSPDTKFNQTVFFILKTCWQTNMIFASSFDFIFVQKRVKYLCPIFMQVHRGMEIIISGEQNFETTTADNRWWEKQILSSRYSIRYILLITRWLIKDLSRICLPHWHHYQCHLVARYRFCHSIIHLTFPCTCSKEQIWS
jgi:hypothetical protein